ncbi:hypothetical protein CUMW_118440 [Citrus unshiu]|nr:hypothetical protein CUMW_118440 [Citrus unshiu]
MSSCSSNEDYLSMVLLGPGLFSQFKITYMFFSLFYFILFWPCFWVNFVPELGKVNTEFVSMLNCRDRFCSHFPCQLLMLVEHENVASPNR